MQLDGRMFTGMFRRAGMIKRDQLSLFPFMLVLFTLSFLLRVRSIHMDVFGDETLYYYLSKTLGIAPASTKDLPPLWTHFSVRPFLYLFFFPWAQLGFIPFRLVNILVGCTVPCLIFALSTRMRVNAYLAMCFALLASLHPQLIFHSVVAFPDMLATALLLGGLLAYFSDSTRWATLLFCLSVLTKEAFAMFLVPLLVDGSIRMCKAREKLVIAPMVGLAVVAITNGFEVYVLHGALQGWSSRRIEDDFYWAFFWSYWFIPFALLLLLYKEYRVFAISLGAPAFFYVWDHVMKKGADAWYVIGPFSVALFAVTVAVQRAVDTLKTSASLLPDESPAPPLWLRIPKPLCGSNSSDRDRGAAGQRVANNPRRGLACAIRGTVAQGGFRKHRARCRSSQENEAPEPTRYGRVLGLLLLPVRIARAPRGFHVHRGQLSLHHQ